MLIGALLPPRANPLALLRDLFRGEQSIRNPDTSVHAVFKAAPVTLTGLLSMGSEASLSGPTRVLALMRSGRNYSSDRGPDGIRTRVLEPPTCGFQL